MTADRLLHILSLLGPAGAGEDTGSGTGRLCEVAAEVTGMSGAGIMLMAGDGPRGSLCTTNAVATLIATLQYTLVEGPCIDAHTVGASVLEPDLADPGLPRWAAFRPPAVAAGVRAVFGFPVRVGAARLGALNLYRDRPGPLSDDQHADALVMADVVARAILAMQADARPGTLASELDAEADLHLVVHQAAGMISVQLAVPIAEALVRLRGHAFATDRPINEVAAAVVSRDLRFTDLPDGP